MTDCMTIICGGCLAVWDMDFDPPACTCDDPEDDDWHMLYGPSVRPENRRN